MVKSFNPLFYSVYWVFYAFYGRLNIMRRGMHFFLSNYHTELQYISSIYLL